MNKLFYITLSIGLVTTSEAKATLTAEQIVTSAAGGVVIAWPTILDLPEWRCRRSSGVACSADDLGNPNLRQILIASTGFAGAEGRDAFFTDFNASVELMINAEQAWTATKKNQLIWIGYYTAGGELNAPDATFHAGIKVHPIRGHATTLDQEEVYAWVEKVKATTLPQLRPLAAAVLFNSFQDDVTANAAPPSVIGKPFGVCKFMRQDLIARGAYVPAHELAHAGLNFLDEYVEEGFQDLNIRTMDLLTPLVLLDFSWRGLTDAIDNVFRVYTYRISDVLSHNGGDNMTTARFPATVLGPGYVGQDYQYEGGMFFGRGTFHMRGSNLMNSGFVQRGFGDDFAYDHSPSQKLVIKEAFGGGVQRPNDRLRTAGPNTDWKMSFGSTTRLMTFDADKLHHFHPTKRYDIQIGWWERSWHTCWWGPFPYACHEDTWRVAERSQNPDLRGITLSLTAGYGLATLAQRVVCAFGINEIKMTGGTFKLCEQSLDEIAGSFIPTVTFRLPYQDIDAPASQVLTTYYWRFRTANEGYTSQWTGWSSFRRIF